MIETDRIQFRGNWVQFKVQAKLAADNKAFYMTTVNKYINIWALISTLWYAWLSQPWPCLLPILLMITTSKWNSTSPYPKRADSKHMTFSRRLLWRVLDMTPCSLVTFLKLQTSKALLEHGRNLSYHLSIKHASQPYLCMHEMTVVIWYSVIPL